MQPLFTTITLSVSLVDQYSIFSSQHRHFQAECDNNKKEEHVVGHLEQNFRVVKSSSRIVYERYLKDW